jgi:hypothetical protein
MSTQKYKLSPDVVMQTSRAGNQTILYHINVDELYTLEGDVARLCEFLLTSRQEKRSVTLDELRNYLNGESPIFQSNLNQTQVLIAAINLLKELKIIEDD